TIEDQQETIIDSVARNWQKEQQYDQLVIERNRLRAKLEDAEEELHQERERKVYNESRRREGLEEVAEDMFVNVEE
ncbi:1217_t:CDS:1, partial [Ambispora leptoticha]